MPVQLSLAMIVKNEEALLARVLSDAADVCDEMVVIDTGSTDDTISIAKDNGAVVHDIVWRDDFATARNASFAWCSHPWVMWLDADDVIPEQTKAAIHKVKEWLHDGVDIVATPYHCSIDPDGSVQLSTIRERIVRRESGFKWEGRIHECIPMENAKSVYIPEIVIEHRPGQKRRESHSDRNLRLLEGEIAKGHPTSRTLFYYANELYDHKRYGEALRYYREYLGADKRPSPDRFWALLYVAESARVLRDEDTVRAASADAIALDPSRAEGYVSLGRLFFDRQEWAQAVPLFVAATSAVKPNFGTIRHFDYGYAPWDYLSVALEKLGRREEALAASQRALPGNPQAGRIRANMHWMVDNL